eukprot:2947902-Prymnesium_polylepis.1
MAVIGERPSHARESRANTLDASTEPGSPMLRHVRTPSRHCCTSHSMTASAIRATSEASRVEASPARSRASAKLASARASSASAACAARYRLIASLCCLLARALLPASLSSAASATDLFANSSTLSAMAGCKMTFRKVAIVARSAITSRMAGLNRWLGTPPYANSSPLGWIPMRRSTSKVALPSGQDGWRSTCASTCWIRAATAAAPPSCMVSELSVRQRRFSSSKSSRPPSASGSFRLLPALGSFLRNMPQIALRIPSRCI